MRFVVLSNTSPPHGCRLVAACNSSPPHRRHTTRPRFAQRNLGPLRGVGFQPAITPTRSQAPAWERPPRKLLPPSDYACDHRPRAGRELLPRSGTCRKTRLLISFSASASSRVPPHVAPPVASRRLPVAVGFQPTEHKARKNLRRVATIARSLVATRRVRFPRPRIHRL